MANTPPCDICQTNPTDLLITNVHNGDTLGLCMEDVPAWAETITRAINTEAEQGPEPGPEPEPIPDPHASRLQRPPGKAKSGRKAPPRAQAPEEPPEAPEPAQGTEEGSWTADPEGFAEPATA